jgi:hypothetical protein
MATMLLAALPFGMGATSAAAKFLDCTLSPSDDDNNWLTERYVFKIDEAEGTVLVDDGLIEYVNKGPISGKLVDDSEVKILVTWDLITRSLSGQRTKMIFRGTYFVKLKQFQLRSKPMGYRNDYEANGTCVIS